VYWVMQLDVFRLAFGVAGLLGTVGAIVGTCNAHEQWRNASERLARVKGVQDPSYYRNEQAEYTQTMANCEAVLPFRKRMIACAVTLLLAAIAAPSSRTAAAMILVPKLTSPEVMQPIGAEAKELYQLAKGALRNLAAKPEPQK
jgi:hypothetical protein